MYVQCLCSVITLDANNQCLISRSTSLPSASQQDPTPTSSTETIATDYLPKFMELNAENLKKLCYSLEKISFQEEMIPKIASTILQCRSGMVTRKERSRVKTKEDTWLFFLGTYTDGKEKIAKELASVVFGSYSSVVFIGLRKHSSYSDLRRKRSRLDANHGHLERLLGAICNNPHRVFLIEGVEQLDSESQTKILNVLRTGVIQGAACDQDVSVRDAIVILSCDKFDTKKGNADFDLNLHAESGDVHRSFAADDRLLEAVDGAFVFKP